jgi:hypothetical protein
METIFIVNNNQQSFFRYTKTDNNDTKYNKILLELLTPPKKGGLSHWSRTDKIIFAPHTVHGYLEKTYNELYLELN